MSKRMLTTLKTSFKTTSKTKLKTKFKTMFKTRFKTVLAASLFSVTLAFCSTLLNGQSIQTQLLNACMAEKSNLPMNHINHPCHGTYMSNKSWLSLLSGESPSAHFFYLDLVELIQQTLH